MQKQGVEQLGSSQSEDTIAIVSSSGSWQNRVAEAFGSSGIRTNIFDCEKPLDDVLKEVQRPRAVMLAVPGADRRSMQLVVEWGSRCETDSIPLVVLAGSDSYSVFVKAINSGASHFAPKSDDPILISQLVRDVTETIANYPRIKVLS